MQGTAFSTVRRRRSIAFSIFTTLYLSSHECVSRYGSIHVYAWNKILNFKFFIKKKCLTIPHRSLSEKRSRSSFFSVSSINTNTHTHTHTQNRVSRYECTCDGPGMKLTIDIACKILPLEKDSSIVFALASTLYKDGSDDSDSFDQSSGKPSHLDDFDYAMYGKVFKYIRESGTDSKTVSVYVSFGGLLMRLTGQQEDLKEVKPDMNLYCLIQKLE